MTKTNNTKRGGFYWKNEQPYVAVTGVLSVVAKPSLRYWFGQSVFRAFAADPTLSEKEALAAPWKTSRKAASRGITVHSIVEAYQTTGKIIEDIPEEFKNYANAFYKWVDDVKPTFLENEKTVYSEKHQYAGTLDCLIRSNGRKLLMDVKTSKDAAVYDEAHLQTSAYRQALKEMGTEVDGCFVLALGEKGNYAWVETKDCLEAFLGALELWKFIERKKAEDVGYGGDKR